MLHDVMIGLHAAAGVLSFGAGVLALSLTSTRSPRLAVYLGSLVAMVVFVAVAVAADWSTFDGTSRAVFGGLLGLALFMCWRAYRAVAELRTQTSGWRPRYVDHIGFTLISLFAGFVIVAAIDLDAPDWLVALVAIAGVATGISLTKRVKHRLA